MSNKCPYCGSFRNVCVNPVSFKYVCLACEKFFCKGEQPKQSIFDRITQSEETLAEKLVCHGVTSWDEEYYWSTVCNGIFKTRANAIAATVAKLKEVCND